METRFQETLDWIHGTARFGSKLGLERISHMLSILENPERRVKHLHVAGTNGKGSVTVMIASALRLGGYRTGMYISPYLEDFRERISVNGQMIPKEALVQVTEAVKKATFDTASGGFDQPTEFEIVTAAAFLHYAQEACDYVALEVGLGGRYDATNVVTPCVSVITTISYDHTERLGNTLGKIAFEKAGIIKPGVPVVTGAVEPEAFRVINRVARENGCPLVTVGRDGTDDVFWPKDAAVVWKEISRSTEGQVIDVWGTGFRHRLRIPLLGKHQQQNAAIAVASLQTAMSYGSPPLYLDPAAIIEGIALTRWPGRMEILWKNPYIVLDCAHNPAGIKAVSEAIKDIPHENLICVFGILGDKSYDEATSFIAPICDQMILTAPEGPRALDPRVLYEEVQKHIGNAPGRIMIEPDLRAAFDRALAQAGQGDAILCCGSIYLAGPLRTHIRQRLGITE